MLNHNIEFSGRNSIICCCSFGRKKGVLSAMTAFPFFCGAPSGARF